MVRGGLPSFRTKKAGGNDADGDPVEPMGAIADSPPRGTGAMQVYEPGDTAKSWKGATSPTSSRNLLFESERESARKDNLQLCCKMCIFFVYLIVFTASMLAEQGKSPARLADHIRATIDGGAVPLAEVSSANQLYDYLEQSFVPAVFGPTVDRTLAAQYSGNLVPFDFANRLLGTVRLRQLRVGLKSDCQLSPMFQAYRVSCYPAFGSGTESAGAFGSGGAYYSYSGDGSGTTFDGKFGSYGSGGFMHLLPTNASQALASVAALRQGQYMDAATRAVFLEFNIWSSNVATLASVTVLAEFGATGGVRQQVSVMTLSQGVLTPGGLGSLADWFTFFGVIVVVIFNLYFIYEEAKEIWDSRWRYFLDAWNVLDWINMILLLVAFVFRCLNFADASSANIGGEALVNSMSFANLRGLAYRAHMVNMFHAVNAALLWGKAVKYFRFIPLVKDIVLVVWKALDLFLPFVVMFAVAFMGFAMAYNISFGDKILELSTFYQSAVYLLRAFLRDIKLMTVYDLATPIFAATLILLYYVTLILVGASFLLAIIADALFHSKFKSDDKPNPYHKDEPCEEFMRELRRRFPKLFTCSCCSRCRRRSPPKGGKQDAQPEEQDGRADGFPSPAKGELMMGFDGSSSISGSSRAQLALPSRHELMRAVELMSGRILSEVAIVGIEIRSELHEVCERVAQMQMAVEELTHRAEKVRLEQEAGVH